MYIFIYTYINININIYINLSKIIKLKDAFFLICSTSDKSRHMIKIQIIFPKN